MSAMKNAAPCSFPERNCLYLPSFPPGEGMPEGALCKVHLGRLILQELGAQRLCWRLRNFTKSACLRIKNRFGGGYVECNAVYGDGMESSNGFYMPITTIGQPEDYNGGHGLKLSCCTRPAWFSSVNRICETESEFGTYLLQHP